MRTSVVEGAGLGKGRNSRAFLQDPVTISQGNASTLAQTPDALKLYYRSSLLKAPILGCKVQALLALHAMFG
ncbi:hypothetical protein [Ensifer aridi]|uniref:hypothetical protein n=1 Tax=Ensifer aridi TaxID=1708715 RepID=UPI0003FBD269|nr:hypothetical protein [Ensifer aridi]